MSEVNMSQSTHPQFDDRKAYVPQEKEGSSFVSLHRAGLLLSLVDLIPWVICSSTMDGR